MEFKEKPQIESREKEPKINLEFLFAPHVTESDSNIVKNKIKEADIFCPEFEGWSWKDKQNITAILHGEKNVEAMPEYSHFPSGRKWMEYLYGSQKIVELIDVPDTHFLHEECWNMDAEYDWARDLFLDGRLTAAINNAKKLITKEVRWDKKREEYIQDKIKERLPILIDNSPELQNKQEVKVLILLGAFHTGIYHHLKHDQRFNAKKVHTAPLYIFSYWSELKRKKMFYPEKELGNKEIALSFLQNPFCSYLSQFSDKTTDIYRTFRDIIKKITLKEIKGVSQKTAERSFEDSPAEIICEYFKDILPKNQKEFKNSLKKITLKYGR